MSFTVTCAQCREEVLGADLIGDAEECLLRDHLLAVHPKTVQPDTLTMLLRHFVVSEGSPPAALRERRARCRTVASCTARDESVTGACTLSARAVHAAGHRQRVASSVRGLPLRPAARAAGNVVA